MESTPCESSVSDTLRLSSPFELLSFQIRAEEKFNGYIVKYISDYYEEYGKYPTTAELKRSLSCFRDLIA